MRIVPYDAAVVLDDVVRDLQVPDVGVGEDRAALRDDAGGRPVGPPPISLMLPGKPDLVAAADVEPVDRRLEAGRDGAARQRS